jgi:shikimate dehydrogenase
VSFTFQLGATPIVCDGGPETRLYVLLGHPVAHSRSPAMQGAAFRAIGWDATYVACDVLPDDLPAVWSHLRRLAATGRFAGGNITVPHKQGSLAALDDLAPRAALAGAANTIVVRRDAAGSIELHGDNTDVTGLVAALAECGADLHRARLLVTGTGGMARAAVVAGLEHGAAEIRVLGRDPLRAQDLLDEVSHRWRGRLPLLACAGLEPGAGQLLAHADLWVQAASVGMHAGDPLLLDLDTAPATLFVFDAVYVAGGTALVRAARARGLRSSDGLGLLLHQGAAAFALWTGKPAPLESMRAALAA